MKPITMTEKRFFEWHEDDVSVTLRNRGGSYGGGARYSLSALSENHRSNLRKRLQRSRQLVRIRRQADCPNKGMKEVIGLDLYNQVVTGGGSDEFTSRKRR